MKNFTYCLLLISIVAGTPRWLSAQQSFPGLSDAPFWEVRFAGGSIPQKFRYQLSGTTSICGEEWLEVEAYSPFSQTIATAGYYREADSKVYFRMSSDCSDIAYLMYDYDLQVGDVFNGWTSLDLISGGLPLDFQVIALDTLTIDGGHYRRLTLNYSSPVIGSGFTFWIEGVGDLVHPFYTLNYKDDFVDWALRCVYYNRLPFYGQNCSDSLSQVQRNRFYVDKRATAGSNTGTDWANAFTDLQLALFLAGDGDTIWVAEGTYRPTLNQNRAATFSLKPGLAVYGGFAGDETSLAQRNPWQTPVILSGDIGVLEDSTDNVYHVVSALGVGESARLDGFIIEGGQAKSMNAPGSLDNAGGGMLIAGSEARALSAPRIANCTFRSNAAQNGAGLYVRLASDSALLPIITDCKFEDNHSSGWGGGIHVNANANPNAELMLLRDTFINNTTFVNGGGLEIRDLRGIRAEHCLFRGNRSNEGASVAYISSLKTAAAEFVDCDFEGNIARVTGGFFFISISSATRQDSSFFTFQRCQFLNNQGSDDSGSALAFRNINRYFSIALLDSRFEGNFPDDAISASCAFDSKIDFRADRCVFKNNAPHPFSVRGGAISLVGSPFSNSPQAMSALITNCLFAGNGGAVGVFTGGIIGQFESQLKNCTFFNNGRFPIAKDWSSSQGTTDWYNKIEVSNCIVWEEDAFHDGIGGLFYNANLPPLSLFDYEISHTLVNVADCMNTQGAAACGEGMIFGTYPVFLDSTNGDFRLSACSPALNMGNNDGLDELGLFTDLLGEARVKDATVDLGAFERAAFSVLLDSVAAPSCEGTTDGYAVLALNGTAPYEITWQSSGNEGSGTDMLPSGAYAFTAVDSLGCTDTLSLDIPEAVPVSVEAEIEPAGNSMLGSITLTSVSGGTPSYTYLWSTGAVGTSISGLFAGTYALTVTDQLGCESVWLFEVELAVGQREASALAPLSVYPNPVSSGESLSLLGYSGAQSGVLSIYDSAGRLRQKAWPVASTLSTEGLSPGLYFLVLHSTAGEAIGYKRFVVQ